MLKALKWPMQILELLICNNEQAVLALREARVVEALGQILVMFGWRPSKHKAEAVTVLKDTARVLATVMVRADAKRQFMADSLQPLMSLFNLLREAGSVGREAADQMELVANGLKTTRIATAEPAYMLKIHEQYGDFLVLVAHLMGRYGESKII